MKIDQKQDPGYETVSIDCVGFADPYAVEGVLVLRTESGKEFPIRAFSGEVAKHISDFLENKEESVPTIYKMILEMCEENEQMLVKVKIYDAGGDMLRANLYLAGKKDIILRNYRASDALALASIYNIPILIRRSLLTEKLEV